MTRLLLLAVLGVCACDAGGDAQATPDAAPAPDACVPGAVTLQVTSPAAYACMEDFTAQLEVTNGACDQLTITGIHLAALVTAGPCGPPGPGDYQPTVATLAAGATATVLDLTTGPFCCTAPGCPATLECDEQFTFTLSTSRGVLSGTADTHLSLGGCPTVCQ
jgi:hypothetical protein